MKLVGLDTGVFVAGVFWRHEPHACVEAWFRGLICPVVCRSAVGAINISPGHEPGENASLNQSAPAGATE